MLLTKEVEVKLWGANVKYYNDKGYKGKHGDIITVKVEDLPHNSHIKVDVLCDYCKTEVSHVAYYNYSKRVGKTGTYACSECRIIKIQETNKIKYGFKSPFQNENVKAKYRENCIEKYGVDNTLKLKEVREKIEKTCLEKYGVTNPLKDKNIKQKQINTLFEHFGVSNPMHSDNIKEKAAQSLYESNGVCTSKQQRHLHKLYGGELNYPVSYFSADICIPDEKIVIEYNGGGHDLCVKTEKISQEEFDRKEIIRQATLKRQGYRTITIISTKDLLPSDTILLQMLSQAQTYFNSTPHTWCTFDIDNSTIRNAEHKTGTPYDFGELRQIKEAS